MPNASSKTYETFRSLGASLQTHILTAQNALFYALKQEQWVHENKIIPQRV